MASAPTPEHLANLRYLKDKRVCERIEAMMKHVLQHRPEDPIIAMCNVLRSAPLRSSAGSAGLGGAAGLHGGTGGALVGFGGGGSATGAPANSGRSVALTTPSGTALNSKAGPFAPPAGGGAHETSRRGSVRENFSRVGSANSHRIERDESSKSDVSAFSVNSVDMGEFLAEFRAAHFSMFGPSSASAAACATAPGAYISLNELGEIVDRVALPLPDTRILRDLFVELDLEKKDSVSFDAFLARMNYRIQGRYHPDILRHLFAQLCTRGGANTATATTTVATTADHQPAVIPSASNNLTSTAGAAASTAARAAVDVALDDVNADDIALAQESVSSPVVSARGGGTTAAAANGESTSRSASGGGGATTTLHGPANAKSAQSMLISKAACFDGLKHGLGVTLTPKQYEDVLNRLGLGSSNGAATVVASTAVAPADAATGGTPLSPSSTMPSPSSTQQVPSLHLLDFVRVVTAATIQSAVPLSSGGGGGGGAYPPSAHGGDD